MAKVGEPCEEAAELRRESRSLCPLLFSVPLPLLLKVHFRRQFKETL